MQQNSSVSPYKLNNEELLFLLQCGILSHPRGRSKSQTPCHGLLNCHVQIFLCALTRCADAKNIMLFSRPHLQRSKRIPLKGVRIPTTLLGNHLNLVSQEGIGLHVKQSKSVIIGLDEGLGSAKSQYRYCYNLFVRGELVAKKSFEFVSPSSPSPTQHARATRDS